MIYLPQTAEHDSLIRRETSSSYIGPVSTSGAELSFSSTQTLRWREQRKPPKTSRHSRSLSPPTRCCRRLRKLAVCRDSASTAPPMLRAPVLDSVLVILIVRRTAPGKRAAVEAYFAKLKWSRRAVIWKNSTLEDLTVGCWSEGSQRVCAWVQLAVCVHMIHCRLRTSTVSDASGL